jgi:hypothetical protein
VLKLVMTSQRLFVVYFQVGLVSKVLDPNDLT